MLKKRQNLPACVNDRFSPKQIEETAKGPLPLQLEFAELLSEQNKALCAFSSYRKKLEALIRAHANTLTALSEQLKNAIESCERLTHELRRKSGREKEMNTAMRVLLDKRKEDCLRAEENSRFKIYQLIKPYLDELESSGLSCQQKQLANMIRVTLQEAAYAPVSDFHWQYKVLSPNELQVANLIRKGKTTKEIAGILNLSERTIESYRNSIRKKLGLKNKKVNLNTYFSAQSADPVFKR
jgi:DNA-binding CsgD family transcriptional regulator